MPELNNGAIYIEDIDCLAFSDLHLGSYESDPAQHYPEPTTQKVAQRVKELIDRYQPKTVVFNGDTFHHTIPTQESQDAIEDILSYGDYESVMTVGNHEDTKENITDFIDADIVCEEYNKEGYVFAHGHKTPTKTGDLFIIGHAHPAVSINTQMHKCYIRGRWQNSSVVVLPAFNYDIVGTDVRKVDFTGICPVLAESSELKFSRLRNARWHGFQPL